MNTNKAHWSTKDTHIALSMPIAKVDKERRIVSGFATLDNLDKQGDVVPAEASRKAFEGFRGNIREMHQPIAVGKIVSFKEDQYFDEDSEKFYNGIYVSAYVSKGAQDTWEKVLDGTLTGFSIGGEIHDAEKIYDEEMEKSYQVIKEYSLSELSLVDNPANQFANVISVEKGAKGGFLMKATIENVFWCKKDDVVKMSFDERIACPQCEKAMTNIGFVETNDEDKASVVKSIVKAEKKEKVFKNIEKGSFVRGENVVGMVTDIVVRGGARISSESEVIKAMPDDPVVIIKEYSQNEGIIVPTSRRVIKNISSLEKVNAISKSEVKEVSKMDSDVIVVDEVEKSDAVEPENTALPVETSDSTAVDAEKGDGMKEEKKEGEEEMAEKAEDAETEKSMDEEMEEEAEKAVTPEITKSDAAAEAVEEINKSLTSVLSSLAETVKALDAKIEGINKSVAGITSEVEEVKDSLGKRVDAMEQDTAFRKSADLGEIVQEEPVMVEKSTTWGGRFLTNADLF